jgi:hypothetical protein
MGNSVKEFEQRLYLLLEKDQEKENILDFIKRLPYNELLNCTEFIFYKYRSYSYFNAEMEKMNKQVMAILAGQLILQIVLKGTFYEKGKFALTYLKKHNQLFSDFPEEDEFINQTLQPVVDGIGKASYYDALKLYFFNKNDRDPDDSDLFYLNTAHSVELELKFRDYWKKCSDCLSSDKFDQFKAHLKEFDSFLSSNKDILVAYQLIRYAKENNSQRDSLTLKDFLSNGFYLLVLYYFYLIAQRIKPKYYGHGFKNKAEETFFFSPISGYYYYSNYKLCFVEGIKKLYSSALLDLLIGFCSLMKLSDKQNFTLVNEEEKNDIYLKIKAIQQNPDGHPAATKKFAIQPTRSPLRYYQIGNSIGNHTIVYYDGNYRVYLEYMGLNSILFYTPAYYGLGLIYDNYYLWDQLWERNKQLLTTIPGMINVLGYIPDLVSGGFTALVKSILIDVGTDVALDKFSKATGDDSIMSAAGVIRSVAKGKMDGLTKRSRDLVKSSADDMLGRLGTPEVKINDSVHHVEEMSRATRMTTGVGTSVDTILVREVLPAGSRTKYPFIKTIEGRIKRTHLENVSKIDYYVYRLKTGPLTLKYGITTDPLQRMSGYKYAKGSMKVDFDRMEIIVGPLTGGKFEALKVESALISEHLEIDQLSQQLLLNLRNETTAEMKGGVDIVDMTAPVDRLFHPDGPSLITLSFQNGK